MLQIKNIQTIWRRTAIKGCAIVISVPMNTEKGRNNDANKVGEICD